MEQPTVNFVAVNVPATSVDACIIGISGEVTILSVRLATEEPTVNIDSQH